MPPRVIESYETYSPPPWVRPLVERLLARTSEKYLGGLGSIVLTDKGSLPRERRRARYKARKRKYTAADTRALYHGSWHGQPAWIELFVDCIPGRRWLRLPVVRDFALGWVFFHELGHHIHRVHRPEFRDREDVADDWAARLTLEYCRSEYRFSLWPALWVMATLLGPFRRRLVRRR